MRLIVIGNRAINYDKIRSVQFDRKVREDGPAVHLMSFDDREHVAIPADSPEGAALLWFCTRGQHPFIWTRPNDIVAAHAEFLANGEKAIGPGGSEPEIEALILEFRSLPRERFEEAFESYRFAPVA